MRCTEAGSGAWPARLALRSSEPGDISNSNVIRTVQGYPGAGHPSPTGLVAREGIPPRHAQKKYLGIDIPRPDSVGAGNITSDNRS